MFDVHLFGGITYDPLCPATKNLLPIAEYPILEVMVERTNTISLKIDGEGVYPDTVSLHDLMYILENLEKALAATARHAQEADRDDDLTLSLASIQRSSCAPTIAVSDSMFRAAGVVSYSLASHEFHSLTTQAQDSLHQIWRRVSQRNWKFSFVREEGIAPAIISADEELAAFAGVTGPTTIYARCERSGGTSSPTAQLVLLSGERITATLQDKQMAIELGKRGLYQVYELDGEATWNEDWKITQFSVTSIGDYNDVGITNAFQRLADAAGSAWDGVDPDVFVQELRAD